MESEEGGDDIIVTAVVASLVMQNKSKGRFEARNVPAVEDKRIPLVKGLKDTAQSPIFGWTQQSKGKRQRPTNCADSYHTKEEQDNLSSLEKALGNKVSTRWVPVHTSFTALVSDILVELALHDWGLPTNTSIV